MEDFDSSDYIEVYDDQKSDYISILCNGQPIINVQKKNREYSLFTMNSFKLIVNNGPDNDFTKLFNEYKSGVHAVIRCPVSIEILNQDGNLVYTLENSAVGSYYTDYGNFYVYEEEDGGYGKVLDLTEGYTARIVGEDTGTMAIEYYAVEDGTLSEPKCFTNVPLSAEFTATFEKTSDGELLLAADTDGDDVVDAKIGYDGTIIAVETLAISQNYVVLNCQESTQLSVTVQPAELIETIQWSVEEGGEEVVAVDSNGNVTALTAGTAYVLATVNSGEKHLIARCRVDVAEKMEIAGIQLASTKATSELYSTDYAELEVLLQLPQNNTIKSVEADSQIPEDLGVAIESARFKDETAAKYFDLIPQDDRTIAIVPTDYAVKNPGEVKGSYKSAVIVTVAGKEHTSEVLALTVKKSTPKLKVSIPAFNSFYDGQSQDMVITGGTVTEVNLDASKTQPNWLTLNGQTLTLNEKAPAKSASVKAYLQIWTEEWRIPAAITLTVKNTYKAATLKLSASTVTLNTAVTDKVTVTLTATKKVSISLAKDKWYYTGNPICPNVIITDADGNDISDGFTVSYGANTKVGTGTVTITGRPDMGYLGAKTVKFTILPKWAKWIFG